MKTIDVPLASLKPWPKNPRIMPPREAEALQRSIKEFGFVQPVVVNKRTGEIVGGHQRVDAAKAIGLKTVPVLYVDIDEASAAQLAIALNRIGGEWDEDLLTEVLADLKTSDADLALTGFDDGELDRLLAQVDLKIGATDPDAIPENVEPMTKKGDIYACGEHRLMCGDATQADDWKRLSGRKTFDLVLTDPPYGVAMADKNAWLDSLDKGCRVETPIVGDHDEAQKTAETLWGPALGLAYEHSRRGAVLYCFSAQGGNQMMMMMMVKAKWNPTLHQLIWVKNVHVLGRTDYAYRHEPILYTWKDAGHKFYGPHQTSVIEMDKPHASPLHPSTKPVALLSLLMQNSSRRSETVADPFLGSGTTLIAAEQLGRICYGMDIEPRYVDTAVARWENFTGKKASRL